MKIQNILFLVFIFQILSININAQTKGDSLIVFVGELINVEYVPATKDIRTEIRNGDTIEVEIPEFNSKYKSKFKVIKLINGFYNQDTIDFFSYVHSEYPGYIKYKHSLLFISQYGEELVQQKYTYFPVYKTKNGRWASDYSYSDYRHPFRNEFTVHPENIEFEKELSFDISKMRKTDIEQRYPKEYYDIKDGKAIAKFGNYIEELFELKKQGYLKARGFF